MEEDDDDFIYGTSAAVEPPALQTQAAFVAEPQPVTPIQPLDNEESLLRERSVSMDQPVKNGDEPSVKQEEDQADQADQADQDQADAEGEEAEEEEEEEEEESEESDIEIIIDPEERNRAMHRDFRPQGGHRTTSFDTAAPASGTPPPPSRAPHLTTEYTIMPRGEIPSQPTAPPPIPLPAPQQKQQSEEPKRSTTPTQGLTQDSSTLPPARAPPSHPPINPEEPGTIDNRSIFEIDMDALAEKPWRRPGTDISDYFNYGFDEVSWEAYCYRRRDLGEMANHLKGVVTNFAGMPEDQIAALPPDVRAMVMTGATQLMSGGGMPGGPGMMGVGVGGPGGMMQDMGMMGMMNGGDVQAMQAAGMMQGGMSDGDVMGMQGMSQDGYQGAGPGGPSGPMMGMGQEFGMQDPNGMGMFPQNVDGSGVATQTPTPVPPQGPVAVPSPVLGGAGPVNAPTGPAAGRVPPAAPQAAFRGRGAPTPPLGIMRGRGGFGRGRGRGGMFMPDSGPPIPVRPASPLPPNVPTGPRNQNRYKDRDNNAQAVDGLDYGGGAQGSSDMDDRGSRKRRGSPSQEDGRSSKRR
ncbi:hypothetical protein M422DRAFT_25436 [Sphaerobolus stellatus SS14]|nr:hypothetical protein M422DRAFT_25436 [Sphaerobolus stellatus SS14]